MKKDGEGQAEVVTSSQIKSAILCSECSMFSGQSCRNVLLDAI